MLSVILGCKFLMKHCLMSKTNLLNITYVFFSKIQLGFDCSLTFGFQAFLGFHRRGGGHIWSTKGSVLGNIKVTSWAKLGSGFTSVNLQ